MLAAALAAGATAAEGAATPPRLEWVGASADGRSGEVRLAPLDPPVAERLASALLEPGACARLLRVVALPDARTDDGTLPALWGDCRVESGALLFKPRHALAPNVVLEARLDTAELSRVAGGKRTDVGGLRYVVPGADAAATVVASVSPSGDEVPANLLRIYVEYSAPMSLAGIDRHVRLVDGAGREIAQAFVETRDGLWDPERRRLTLFVHPGRQKRGVALGEALGPPLAPGATVQLVIDRSARDADGRPLAAPFERSWRVGPPVRTALDPASWRVAAPEGPREALVVEAERPLDRALVLRLARVIDPASGLEIAGEVALDPGERVLRFVPRSAWDAGARYELRIDAALEDPSGNRVGQPFERAAGESAAARETILPFRAAFVAAQTVAR